ncbi:MAG: RMD1 family protein [Rickettsiella sp.]|nr:RMD1 family protein [Rickettsiella sp.]
MRCISFCTAASYKLSALADFFRSRHYIAKLFRNVLYVTKKHKNIDIFFFNHGCFVTWNLRKKQEEELLEVIKPFSTDPVEKIETDRFIYHIAKDTRLFPHTRFNVDVISIEKTEIDNIQLKLAISYGLAQSIKLEFYEESIQKTIRANSHFPRELAQDGKISLSRKAISKRIGEIFLTRSSVNLSSEYLDVPEYFWRYSNLEAFYEMTEKFLDIPKRVAALNHKLDVVHEILEMLNNQLEHRYSSILESVIILLIFIEIVVQIIQHL